MTPLQFHYPDIAKCSSSEELHAVVADCADKLRIPITLPVWPGQWGVTANGLRWDSCEHEGWDAERRLLLANLLMDGEARHTEIMRQTRARQDALTAEAATYLNSWVDQVNAELEFYPAYAEKLDTLTALALSLDYARFFRDEREARYNAMRTALRLAMGLWRLEIDGKPAVTMGSRLKSLANATNHVEAADKLGAWRI